MDKEAWYKTTDELKDMEQDSAEVVAFRAALRSTSAALEVMKNLPSSEELYPALRCLVLMSAYLCSPPSENDGLLSKMHHAGGRAAKNAKRAKHSFAAMYSDIAADAVFAMGTGRLGKGSEEMTDYAGNAAKHVAYRSDLAFHEHSSELESIARSALTIDTRILRSDATASRTLVSTRLWHDFDVPSPKMNDHFALVFGLKASRFWSVWYDGFIFGEPIDWLLQSQVARIDEEVWEGSSDILSKTVGLIYGQFELVRKIEELERSRVEIEAKWTRRGIGGNRPPEDMSIDGTTTEEIQLVWAAIHDLKATAEQEKPNKDKLRSAIKSLIDAFAAMATWAGRKGDLTVDEAIKWGVPIGGAALLTNPKLVSDIIQVAKNILALI